jgi:hypothetical protein
MEVILAEGLEIGQLGVVAINGLGRGCLGLEYRIALLQGLLPNFRRGKALTRFAGYVGCVMHGPSSTTQGAEFIGRIELTGFRKALQVLHYSIRVR